MTQKPFQGNGCLSVELQFNNILTCSNLRSDSENFAVGWYVITNSSAKEKKQQFPFDRVLNGKLSKMCSSNSALLCFNGRFSDVFCT